MSDLISRQEVSDIIKTRLYQTALNNDEYITSYAKVCVDIADNRIDTWINEAKAVEEFSDLIDFVSDIIGIYHNATGYGYYPEDLEVDFDEVMEKWSKKIEHYKWGKRNDNTCN